MTAVVMMIAQMNRMMKMAVPRLVMLTGKPKLNNVKGVEGSNERETPTPLRQPSATSLGCLICFGKQKMMCQMMIVG